ncbi:MAG: HAD family hydrolase [Butyricicoccus sp.]|nr:HAD family hydrolase [Butyricicoccus sp.]
MAAIKGVFFDLGGTLRILHKDPEHQAKARARMAELAGWADADALQELLEKRYDVYREWALGENKESGDYELWAKWLLPELDAEKLQEICHEMTFQYRQVKGVRYVVEGGLEVIRGLRARGYKLAIISNLIGENEIPDWLRADGLTEYFDAVVLSSVCHIRKPDPEIYRMAAEQMGLTTAECVSVADNLGRDITGAKAAGVGANILFISPEKLAKKTITEENKPDYIVHRFIDILDLPVFEA